MRSAALLVLCLLMAEWNLPQAEECLLGEEGNGLDGKDHGPVVHESVLVRTPRFREAGTSAHLHVRAFGRRMTLRVHHEPDFLAPSFRVEMASSQPDSRRTLRFPGAERWLRRCFYSGAVVVMWPRNGDYFSAPSADIPATSSYKDYLSLAKDYISYLFDYLVPVSSATDDASSDERNRFAPPLSLPSSAALSLCGGIMGAFRVGDEDFTIKPRYRLAGWRTRHVAGPAGTRRRSGGAATWPPAGRAEREHVVTRVGTGSPGAGRRRRSAEYDRGRGGPSAGHGEGVRWGEVRPRRLDTLLVCDAGVARAHRGDAHVHEVAHYALALAHAARALLAHATTRQRLHLAVARIVVLEDDDDDALRGGRGEAAPRGHAGSAHPKEAREGRTDVAGGRRKAATGRRQVTRGHKGVGKSHALDDRMLGGGEVVFERHGPPVERTMTAKGNISRDVTIHSSVLTDDVVNVHEEPPVDNVGNEDRGSWAAEHVALSAGFGGDPSKVSSEQDSKVLSRSVSLVNGEVLSSDRGSLRRNGPHTGENSGTAARSRSTRDFLDSPINGRLLSKKAAMEVNSSMNVHARLHYNHVQRTPAVLRWKRGMNLEGDPTRERNASSRSTFPGDRGQLVTTTRNNSSVVSRVDGNPRGVSPTVVKWSKLNETSGMSYGKLAGGKSSTDDKADSIFSKDGTFLMLNKTKGKSSVDKEGYVLPLVSTTMSVHTRPLVNGETNNTSVAQSKSDIMSSLLTAGKLSLHEQSNEKSGNCKSALGDISNCKSKGKLQANGYLQDKQQKDSELSSVSPLHGKSDVELQEDGELWVKTDQDLSKSGILYDKFPVDDKPYNKSQLSDNSEGKSIANFFPDGKKEIEPECLSLLCKKLNCKLPLSAKADTKPCPGSKAGGKLDSTSDSKPSGKPVPTGTSNGKPQPLFKPGSNTDGKADGTLDSKPLPLGKLDGKSHSNLSANCKFDGKAECNSGDKMPPSLQPDKHVHGQAKGKPPPKGEAGGETGSKLINRWPLLGTSDSKSDRKLNENSDGKIDADLDRIPISKSYNKTENSKSVDTFESKSDAKSDGKLSSKLDEKSHVKFESKSEGQVAAKSDIKHEGKSQPKEGDNRNSKPLFDKSSGKTGHKLNGTLTPLGSSANKVYNNSGSAKSDGKSDDKSSSKLTSQSDHKPHSKPAIKSNANAPIERHGGKAKHQVNGTTTTPAVKSEAHHKPHDKPSGRAAGKSDDEKPNGKHGGEANGTSLPAGRGRGEPVANGTRGGAGAAVAAPAVRIPRDAAAVLRSFCAWQRRETRGAVPKHHVAVLLTRQELCGAHTCHTLGMADVGTVCDPQRSCAVIRDHGMAAAYTMAHEIGHILGLPHDESKACSEILKGTDAAQPPPLGSSARPRAHIMSATLAHVDPARPWSPCSAALFDDIFHSGGADCLLSPPAAPPPLAAHAAGPTPFTPGARYPASVQCRLAFGPGARVCAHTAPCAKLWCAVPGAALEGGAHRGKVCVTRHLPWAQGTVCGHGRWCSHGVCTSVEQHASDLDGSWGGWGPWGPCSRSCGGGAQVSPRACDSPAPRGHGAYCGGARVRYRSCHTRACPLTTGLSFREEQCAQHNSAGAPGALGTRHAGSLGGRTSRPVLWVPKVSGVSLADRCKLLCRANGTAYYYMFARRVVDGTACGAEPGGGVCVEGKCVPTGCDAILGSRAVRDRCGVCDGDGSACTLVSGAFTRPKRFGYNHVVTFPAGSARIQVTQTSSPPPQPSAPSAPPPPSLPSSSKSPDAVYLAVRGADGRYLLNGRLIVTPNSRNIHLLPATAAPAQQRDSAGRSKHGAVGAGPARESAMQYSGAFSNPETLRVLLPIPEALSLEVLCAGSGGKSKLPTVWLKYSFAAPRTGQADAGKGQLEKIDKQHGESKWQEERGGIVQRDTGNQKGQGRHVKGQQGKEHHVQQEKIYPEQPGDNIKRQQEKSKSLHDKVVTQASKGGDQNDGRHRPGVHLKPVAKEARVDARSEGQQLKGQKNASHPTKGQQGKGNWRSYPTKDQHKGSVVPSKGQSHNGQQGKGERRQGDSKQHLSTEDRSKP